MAGINPISFDMPEYQRAEATRSVSHLAASTTGKADDDLKKSKLDQHSHHIEEESIDLSSTAQLLTKEENENDKKAQQEELKDKQQMQQKMHSVSGHAAQATFTKKEAKGSGDAKETEKHKKPAGDEGGDTLTDLESFQTELGEAFTTGAMDRELKRTAGKKTEGPGARDSDRTISYRSHESETGAGEHHVKPEMLEQVLNRDPKQILADIPPQFKAFAEQNVNGQIDPTGKPKESLTQLKADPAVRVECARLELMPSENVEILDIAVENPPIPDLSQTDVAS